MAAVNFSELTRLFKSQQRLLGAGDIAYLRGDYLNALDAWQSLADKGDAQALNKIGASYLKGEGVASNPVVAYLWFTLALTRGNEEATYNREHAAKLMSNTELNVASKITATWHKRTTASKVRELIPELTQFDTQNPNTEALARSLGRSRMPAPSAQLNANGSLINTSA